MAVDEELIQELSRITEEITRVLYTFAEERKREEERLERAAWQKEKLEIQRRMAEKDKATHDTVQSLKKEFDIKMDIYDRYAGGEINDQDLENILHDHEVTIGMSELYNRPQTNLWPDGSSQTDLLALPERSLNMYYRICSEADAHAQFKDPENKNDFEFVVLDRIANTDYPQKAQDLETLAIMQENTGYSTVSEILKFEDWPRIDGKTNLDIADYIPDDEKETISETWLNNYRKRSKQAYAQNEDSFKHDPSEFNKFSYDLTKGMLQLSELPDREMMEKILEGMVLTNKNLVFRKDASEYIDDLRTRIIERDKVRQDLSFEEIREYLENVAPEYLDKMYVGISKEWAMQLFDKGVPIWNNENIHNKILQIRELDDIAIEINPEALVVDKHDFYEYCKKIAEKELGENIFDYRTEIDPMMGLRESINELTGKRQPTAPSVQDELEEDIIYGIGEVGDSNQEVILEEEIQDEGR